MTGSIYKIENKINGKVYIGQTVMPNNRKDKHWNDLIRNSHSNRHMQSCYNLHSQQNIDINNVFCFDIIESDIDVLNLTSREQFYLDYYKGMTECYNYGNFVDKPCRGMKYSEETKAKMSIAKKNRVVTEETKKKISENSKGNTYRRGKTQSDETKQKLREMNLGKKLSQETKDKMSAARMGRKYSEETKAKIKKSNELNILRQMISPEGILFEFYNIHEFCKTHGLDVSNTSTVLNDRRPSHKGWTKFKN